MGCDIVLGNRHCANVHRNFHSKTPIKSCKMFVLQHIFFNILFVYIMSTFYGSLISQW